MLYCNIYVCKCGGLSIIKVVRDLVDQISPTNDHTGEELFTEIYIQETPVLFFGHKLTHSSDLYNCVTQV